MTEKPSEEFPWHLGVFDAHCHPTDTISSLSSIPQMQAAGLLIMATRAQDQNLVDEAASASGVQAQDSFQDQGLSDEDRRTIIPAFGWHPWFSHQLYDDTSLDKSNLHAAPDKLEHYRQVLTPTPPSGDASDPDQKREDKFLASLPEPRPLSGFLCETEERLAKYPYALVGEIGLDRAFRLPREWVPEEEQQRDSSLTPGSREGRRLSPYKVQLSHQKAIFKAQLQLAGKLRRAVSVHSVQAHGAILEVFEELWKGHEKESKRQQKRKKDAVGTDELRREEDSSDTAEALPFPPRICMHSYSGPPEPLRQFLRPSVPSDIFFSFSDVINFTNPSTSKVVQVIKKLDGDKILSESDLHCAGERMDGLLENVVKRICETKEWEVEDGVKILKQNWLSFVFGDD